MSVQECRIQALISSPEVAMKYAAGVVSGVLIAVFGQWVLAAAPDVGAASAHLSIAWEWAHEAAAARVWWFVVLLGVPALLAVAVAVLATRQDDWLTEHIGYSMGLGGIALAAALATVVATATGHAGRATACVLTFAALVAWVVRRARVSRRVLSHL